MFSSIEAGISDRFKAAFRRYPTGVAVIAAAGPDGPVGLTVSSLASVAADPPALSFSMMSTPSARAILAAPSFTVNVLGAGHVALAGDFARSEGPRFTSGQGWETLPTGEPILPGAVAALRGVPLQVVPVGTSSVVIATVLEVFLGPPGGRLVHHDRQFFTYPGDEI